MNVRNSRRERITDPVPTEIEVEGLFALLLLLCLSGPCRQHKGEQPEYE